MPRGAASVSNVMRVFPWFTRGDYTLENSELIFSATGRISNALSAMPIQLYAKTKPKYNDLNDMVGFAPNPNMTSSNFFKTMEACRCTAGNAYALKVLDANWQLERLDILDPSRVTPVMVDDDLWYEVQPDKGAAYIIHNFHIIHIPFLSTNGYKGINPVSVLIDTLDYSKNIKQYSSAQLEKGINAAVVLQAPGNLAEDQRKQMIETFRSTYKETGGNILLLESGVTAESLKLSPVDAKLFEVEKITRSRVAMVYNLPPHLLGDYSDTSFSTMEQQMLEFLSLTMLPIVTAYEQELNRKLLTKEQRNQGMRFKFRMDNIMRADAKTTAEVNFKLVRSGCKTPNEIRAEYGYQSKKNGDRLFISSDMVTLDFLVSNQGKVEVMAQGGAEFEREDSENDADI